MKQLHKRWKGIKHLLAKIHLVDKCLILFMAILIMQSAYSLFVNHSVSSEMAHIDVVMRTSMAAIFGYILSANFIRHDSPSSARSASGKVAHLSLTEGENRPQNRIGFSSSTADTENLETGMASQEAEVSAEASSFSRLQIIAAASIGLFCLIALIVLRNFSGQIIDTTIPSSPSAAATVTQFRDFVSGCIGFLIGTPTQR